MALYDLTLTYAELSVVFRHWKSADLPRSRKTFVNESIYAVSGNLVKSGPSFELPYLWTIAVDLYQVEYDKIQAIWERLDEARRTNTGALFVALSDETEEVFEYGKTALTKTRTSVAGTTPRELNGGVYYYPHFQADWVAPAEFGRAYASSKFSTTVCPTALNPSIKVRACSLVLQDTRVKI